MTTEETPTFNVAEISGSYANFLVGLLSKVRILDSIVLTPGDYCQSIAQLKM